MIQTEQAKWHVKWKIEKYLGAATGKPYEVLEQEGNCLLKTGINEFFNVLCGGSANHFDNAHATIGVGDDDTAADDDQTDLVAASNKTYKAMDVSYPTFNSSQKATFRATFGTSDANYAWKEWVIKHSTSAICLNRKVSAMGTKATGSWVITVEISLA